MCATYHLWLGQHTHKWWMASLLSRLRINRGVWSNASNTNIKWPWFSEVDGPRTAWSRVLWSRTLSPNLCEWYLCLRLCMFWGNDDFHHPLALMTPCSGLHKSSTIRRYQQRQCSYATGSAGCAATATTAGCEPTHVGRCLGFDWTMLEPDALRKTRDPQDCWNHGGVGMTTLVG